MMLSAIPRSLRASLLVASLSATSALGAQGLSYDMSTTGTGPDRSGAVSTRNYMSAHGQFAGGNSRLDITQSMSPGGMMGMGTYMITNGAKGTVTSVDPAKRQYVVIDIAEMGKTANDMQAALGGMAKIEFADVKVDVQDLGAGEPIDGYATWKYKLVQSYTMRMTMMGRTMNTPSTSSTEIWVAPQLDGLMDPSARPVVATPTGPMAELTKQLTAQYMKMKKGLPLKRITTSVGGEGAHQHTTVMTTLITNVKKAPISPNVFEVPAGYTKVEMMDAMTAAAAAAHKPPQ
ncbi:MAG: hypothetical protein ABI884_01625 [Gemmatimonadota bacterium]